MKRREWFEYATRIGESVMAGVSECHIPNAKRVILSKDGERIAELVAADRREEHELSDIQAEKSRRGHVPFDS